MSITKQLLTLLVVFSVCAIVSGDSAGANSNRGADNVTFEQEEVSVDEEEDDTELPLNTTHHLENLAIVLKLATECETPNGDIGFCVEIKNCTKLLGELANQNAKEFLRASKCGPENEEVTNPKVCCGKYANFKNKPTKVNSMKKQESLSIGTDANRVAESNRKNETTNHNQIVAGEVQFIEEAPAPFTSRPDVTTEVSHIFPKVCGEQKLSINGRIVGGSEATLGEFPWMTRLLHKNKNGEKSYGCSGFLIHTKYVLTAGHCVHDKFITIRGPIFSVVLGEHDIDSKVDCVDGICADPLQISRVEELTVHPGYDPEHQQAHYNDIALIRLKKAAKTNNFVSPVCLNTNTGFTPKEYILSGWGKTESERVSRIKMKVDLPPAPKVECSDMYSSFNVSLRDTQICAGGKGGKDSCNGDSGGPLMYLADNNVWFATGIVSFGIGCGTENWPGVYTSIPYYIPWIKETILEKRKQLHTRRKATAKSADT